jgi:hypothetical protein
MTSSLSRTTVLARMPPGELLPLEDDRLLLDQRDDLTVMLELLLPEL